MMSEREWYESDDHFETEMSYKEYVKTMKSQPFGYSVLSDEDMEKLKERVLK